MKELKEDIFEQILQGNSENLNLEFKASFDFNDNIWARERLIRSILAISNTRDGGYIVIGVTENSDKSLDLIGMTEDHLNLFKSKVEDLKSMVESFSNSPASYEIGIGKYRSGDFVLISISEFALNPLICRKNGAHKDKYLEEGAIYVRTLKDKPSSIKLMNPIDIQDFFERAVDKQIMNLHKRGWSHASESTLSDQSSFQKERGTF